MSYDIPDYNIESKVQYLVTIQLGVDADKVTPQANFAEDLGANSLG